MISHSQILFLPIYKPLLRLGSALDTHSAFQYLIIVLLSEIYAFVLLKKHFVFLIIFAHQFKLHFFIYLAAAVVAVDDGGMRVT